MSQRREEREDRENNKALLQSQSAAASFDLAISGELHALQEFGTQVSQLAHLRSSTSEASRTQVALGADAHYPELSSAEVATANGGQEEEKGPDHLLLAPRALLARFSV